MKKLTIVSVGLFFILAGVSAAYAWSWGKKNAQTSPAAVSGESSTEAKTTTAADKPADKAASDKAIEASLKAKRDAAQKKLNLLNNTEWTIEITAANGKGKKETDAITFRNNQVSIAGYAKKGFSFTNFTLTVQEDGSSVWETMQTSEKSGIAFWRGEMDKKLELMRGVVSYQIDKKNKQDYSFVSTSKKSIPASSK